MSVIVYSEWVTVSGSQFVSLCVMGSWVYGECVLNE